MENRQKFKVTLVGPPDLVKSKFIDRIRHDHPAQNQETHSKPATYIDYTNIELEFWETPGTKELKKLGPVYWKDSIAFILLYNQRIAHSPDELEEFYQLVKNSLQKPFYMIVVADIDVSKGNHKNKEIEQWCSQKGLEHMAICTSTGERMDMLLQDIARKCYEMSRSNT